MTVGLDELAYLDRQFARWGQDQHPDRMPCRRKAGVGVSAETLQGRQHERSRLAGSGLGGGEDIAAGEDQWDCRALNGRRLGVALTRHCGEKVGRQAEVFECQTITPDCVI